ncbi:MAG: TolC family protein [Myxococcaceae bacterium]|nr:TolC family protein [Myxococcaceae bacterium]
MSSPCASAAEASCAVVERSTLVRCALQMSPLVREQLHAREAAEGRREAARPVLPSNPVVAGSGAWRSGSGPGAQQSANWYVTVSQELELAGQRGKRLDAADADLRSLQFRVEAARAETAADAWAAYFRALAAAERTRVAARLETAAASVATTVRAMAVNGLSSEVDADVAETQALRASRVRLEAEADAAALAARARALVGAPPEADVTGTLEPLAVAEAAQPRPELLAVEEERGFFEARGEALGRERIPNPTLSLFVQNDGFDERVLGAGLSFPIPLPQPVGRTRRGERLEAHAEAQRAGAEADRLRREHGLELVAARAAYGAATKARALYTAERTERAAVRLEAIATQVKAGRLAVRDALIAQAALVEQLSGEIDVREQLCLASVRLNRAAGVAP